MKELEELRAWKEAQERQNNKGKRREGPVEGRGVQKQGDEDLGQNKWWQRWTSRKREETIKEVMMPASLSLW